MVQFIKRRKGAVLFSALLLIVIVGAYILNYNMSEFLSVSRERMLGGSLNVRYEHALVKRVVLDDTATDSKSKSGLMVGSQELILELLTGPHKGESVRVFNSPTIYDNVYAKEGAKLIVRVREETADGSGRYITEVFSYNRTPVLFGFIGVFFLLLILVGGKKGAKALVGLVFTMVCVFYVFLPLIFRGVDPIHAVIIIVILTSSVTLTLTGGWNSKSASAIAGTISGVIVSSVIAALVARLSKITVFNTTNVGSLVFLSYDTPIRLNNILFAGVIIAALGAVMDVAISVASAINEIHSVSKNSDQKTLFKSGMNVGKDMIGTMSNTLILAFAGSSVNVLILLYAYSLPFNQLINMDMLAVEILQAISGSVGVILTIPITAYIATFFIARKKTGPIKLNEILIKENKEEL